MMTEAQVDFVPTEHALQPKLTVSPSAIQIVEICGVETPSREAQRHQKTPERPPMLYIAGTTAA